MLALQKLWKMFFISSKKLFLKYFEWGLSKSVKKVNFIFFFQAQSLLMDGIIKNERGLEPLFRLQDKFKNILLFGIYYLTNFDDVM